MYRLHSRATIYVIKAADSYLLKSLSLSLFFCLFCFFNKEFLPNRVYNNPIASRRDWIIIFNNRHMLNNMPSHVPNNSHNIDKSHA